MKPKNVKIQPAKALANVSLKLGKLSADSASRIDCGMVGEDRHTKGISL